MMPPRLLAPFVLTALAAAAAPAAADADPKALLAEIAASRLESVRAVSVGRLALDLGGARLATEGGTFFPATPVAGRVVEAVFIGRARLTLAPPDAIEAGQLELFTGRPSLDEEVSEAVLVIASDAAAQALFRRGAATPTDGETARAVDLYQRWRSGPLRRQLNVEAALLQDGLADPLYQSYFAGLFTGAALGEFLLLIEPDSAEQLTLGQFVPAELTAKEQKQAGRLLHRQQRRGRLIGLALDDLGQWDTWVSAALRGRDGAASPGAPAFEPQRYRLELTLAARDLALAGRAHLTLLATTGRSRVVRMKLHPDLAVHRVRDGEGRELAFHQNREEVLAVLPAAPAAGESAALEVDYGGDLLDKVETGTFHLRDAIHWHPHAGAIDRAPYEVTFRWPERIDLVAAGRLLEEGRGPDGSRFERRALELPSAGFGFEVGKFSLHTRRVGHVEVRLALDPGVPYRERAEVAGRHLDAVGESLAYFAEIFGPYPLDELIVVTTPRLYSQALLGFITLSSLQVGDHGLLSLLLGLEDPRTVVAHEVAHQWWGHMVGWESYRDQWLSEAMANYAAVLFARNRLKGQVRFDIGPTSGWQTALTATTEDGRPIESLGPLVLGERLGSSRADGYVPIVYHKGAVVLDMLARYFGEEKFGELLREVARTTAHRAISTEDFLELLGRLAGADFTRFARQFIFGTGLPEVYYTYRFEPLSGGRWRVVGQARQQSPYRFRYRVAAGPDGGLDVERLRVEQTSAEQSNLIVPLEVVIYDPAREPAEAGGRAAARRRDELRQRGNATLKTHLLLKGEATDIALDLDYEPRELWLDRQEEVFGRFFNERRHPKRVLYYRCLDQAAAGQREAARATCGEALAALTFAGPRYDDSPTEEELAIEGRLLDGEIQLLVARLQLDDSRFAEARAAIDAARTALQPSRRPWYEPGIRLQEARLAVRQARYEDAFRLLRKAVLKRGLDSAEAVLLLAIAAHAGGHPAELQQALDEAKEAGADVTLLTESP
jgi:hypothetical protein